MKIICLVKIIPDVEHFAYDYENNVLNRENNKSIVNPDDACAVAIALHLKNRYGAEVTVVSMGPQTNRKYLEDIVRRGADKAILITDDLYRGSDTYVTSRILAKTIEGIAYDMIFCGTHSMDGDTAHVPAQVAEILGANVMYNVVRVREENLVQQEVWAEVSEEERRLLFTVRLPAVLGITKESKYKLPFVKFEDRKKDVSERITILSNRELNFKQNEVGLQGSGTRVMKTFPRKCSEEGRVVVKNNDDGIEYVYQFLKEKGFIRYD